MRRRVVRIVCSAVQCSVSPLRVGPRFGPKGKTKVTAEEKQVSSELDARIATLTGVRQGFKL